MFCCLQIRKPIHVFYFHQGENFYSHHLKKVNLFPTHIPSGQVFPPLHFLCIFTCHLNLNFYKVLTVEKEDSFFFSKPVAYTMLTMHLFCRTYSTNYFQLFYVFKNFVSNFLLFFPINIFVSSLNCCCVSFSVAFYAH